MRPNNERTAKRQRAELQEDLGLSEMQEERIFCLEKEDFKKDKNNDQEKRNKKEEWERKNGNKTEEMKKRLLRKQKKDNGKKNMNAMNNRG